MTAVEKAKQALTGRPHYATGDELRGTPLDEWVLDVLVHAEP